MQRPVSQPVLEGDFYFFLATSDAKAAATTLPAPPGFEQIARAERGYDLLRQGQTDNAERIFRALAGTAHPEVVWMGREGLAEVALLKGDTAGALAEANQIIASTPTLRQAQEYIADSQDRARQQYVDDAVKELAARFRAPPSRPAAAGAPDDWTSSAMAVSVLPVQDQTPAGGGGRP